MSGNNNYKGSRGGRRENNPGHNKNKSKDNGGKEIEAVSLPYDFIPFPKKWHYEYTEDTLPKHDNFEGLHGYIDYTIQPMTDLAMDFRERGKLENGTAKDKETREYFVMGSSVRGMVRSNMEILSASYPVFIDRTRMLYRDIAGRGISKKNYMEKIGIKDGIEKDIRAGYLKKEGDRFYIQPAKMIEGKNFKAIKEYRLCEWPISKFNENAIYSWAEKKEKLAALQRNEKRIIEITENIKNIRKQIKEYKYECMHEKFNEIDAFFKENMNFNKRFNKRNDTETVKKEMKSDIDVKFYKIMPLQNGLQEKFRKLCDLYKDRIELKAENYLEHRSGIPRNQKFKPYQRNVFYKIGNRGIVEIRSSEMQGYIKGCLFNSTKAASKKSHYLIGEENEDEYPVKISQSTIEEYRLYLKKFRPNSDRNVQDQQRIQTKKRIELFYDIFDGYEKLIEGSAKNYPVVFYSFEKTEDLEKEEAMENSIPKINLGRTPYFKVVHSNQIEDLIEKNEETEENYIDYSRALFGYTADDFRHERENKEMKNYKSRLRFEPVEIKSESKPKEISGFNLMSPQASAQGMYLQQGRREIVGYENEGIELNGYKFYRILSKEIPTNKKKTQEKIGSEKMVLKKDAITEMRGRIHFKNLKKDELGLLLLSLDVNCAKKSDVLKCKLGDEEYFESIGGAKPYGYGKVKMKIEKLAIKKYENSFEGWMGSLVDCKSDIPRYIDLFTEKMNGDYSKNITADYFENIYFKQYLESKKECKAKLNDINWDNIEDEIKAYNKGKKRGGYPKNWYLERRSTSKK